MLHRHSLGMGLLTSLPLLSDLTWNTLSDEGTPLCTYTVGSPPKLMPQSAPLLASNNRGGRSESEEIPHVRVTKVNITSYQCFHLSCPQTPPAREGLGTRLCFHCLILQIGDTIWRLMLVERLLYFLSCQSSVFNFSTQTLSHVQAINSLFL